MPLRTHLQISPTLCGTPMVLSEGRARVELETQDAMRADARGLVHGGFVFGLADYAAMLAINHENVVLGAADVRLSAPVRVGERLVADAQLLRIEGKKHVVEVRVTRDDQPVFSGTFVCFVPARHVLAEELGDET